MSDDEPTFIICRGCPKYRICLGGIHEDCEIGFEDLINGVREEMLEIMNLKDYSDSDNVLIVIENSDEKVFHILDRSDDLDVLQDLATMLKEQHGQENLIIKRHGKYELFTYPVIGDGEDAHLKE
jgi:succinylglutamate desuccinylase